LNWIKKSGQASPKNGGTASFLGTASDPFAYGDGGFIPILGNGHISMSLEFGSDELLPVTPAELEGASWTLTSQAWVSQIPTFDDTVFFSSPRQLLYSLTITANMSGLSVDFFRNTPVGCGFTIAQSDSDIANGVLGAMSGGGFSGDLNVMSGVLDVSGMPSASIGYYDDFYASKPSVVPEPTTWIVFGGALYAGLRRRK
jgi:hypothetical protein